uniref:IlGF domain-containing protein n=1 Tax=Rhabditophanes sp. KR3021 TaxID=114890 RepID=A0AC35U4J9_9BILA
MGFSANSNVKSLQRATKTQGSGVFNLKLALIFVLLFAVICQVPVAECSVRVCGSKLTKLLKNVCRSHKCVQQQGFGPHNVMDLQKRFNSNKVFADLGLTAERNDFGAFQDLAVPMKRGGIATECCIKRCSMQYLKTYCCDEVEDEDNY